MSKSLKDIIIIALTTILLTLLVWLPHIFASSNFYGLDFSNGFNTIYRNYDGIEYIAIAKSLYDPDILSRLPQSLGSNYYAAHFPGYSLLILLGAPFIGFLKSMVIVSFLFTLLSIVLFYVLLKQFNLTNAPLTLSLLFLVLPARWLIVHSVGSSEPVFIFFVILTIFSLMRFEQINKWRWIWIAGIAGFAAQFTRPPGFLLTLAIGIYLLWNILKPHLDKNHDLVLKTDTSSFHQLIKTIKTYYPLLLLPLSLISIFLWYQLAYGDFWMYFKTGDNIHLTFPPFQVFNVNQYWVGDIWLEDLIYIFILGFSSAFILLQKNLRLMGIFVLVYMIAGISIAHRDISRYVLPIAPFVLLSYEKFLTSTKFKWVIVIVLLGIYLYSQNFILNNTAPYPNVEMYN